MLISDRLKGALPQGPLNYVLTQEGEGWYTSEKVASLADVFVNNRATIIGQKATDGKTARVTTTVATDGQRAAQGHQGAREGHFSQWRVHVHLPSQDRSRHGVVDLLVRDPLPRVTVSGAIRVVATATWPGTVCPAGVMALQDSVECHE